MRQLTTAGRDFRFQWASDQEFDGLRLEAWEGELMILDVGVPRDGPITLNTWSNDAPEELVMLALKLAHEDRAGSN